MSEQQRRKHTDIIKAVFVPLQTLFLGSGSKFPRDIESQPWDAAGTASNTTSTNKRRASESESESEPFLDSSEEDEKKFTPAGIIIVCIALVISVWVIYSSIKHMRYRASYKWWHDLADSGKADWHKDAKVVQDLENYFENLRPQLVFALMAVSSFAGIGAAMIQSVCKIWFSRSKNELSVRQEGKCITLGANAVISAISVVFSGPDAILVFLEFFALRDELRAV